MFQQPTLEAVTPTTNLNSTFLVALMTCVAKQLLAYLFNISFSWEQAKPCDLLCSTISLIFEQTNKARRWRRYKPWQRHWGWREWGVFKRKLIESFKGICLLARGVGSLWKMESLGKPQGFWLGVLEGGLDRAGNRAVFWWRPDFWALGKMTLSSSHVDGHC